MREMEENQRNALSFHNAPVCVLSVHIKRSEMTFFFLFGNEFQVEITIA